MCVYAEWCRKIRLIFIFNCLYEHTSGTNFHRFDRLFVSRVSRLQPLPDKTVHRFVFEKTHTAPPITWATHISEKCVPVFRSFFRAAHRSQDDPPSPRKIHRRCMRNPFPLVYTQTASNERKHPRNRKVEETRFRNLPIQLRRAMKNKTGNRIVSRVRHSTRSVSSRRKRNELELCARWRRKATIPPASKERREGRKEGRGEGIRNLCCNVVS